MLSDSQATLRFFLICVCLIETRYSKHIADGAQTQTALDTHRSKHVKNIFGGKLRKTNLKDTRESFEGSGFLTLRNTLRKSAELTVALA